MEVRKQKEKKPRLQGQKRNGVGGCQEARWVISKDTQLDRMHRFQCSDTQQSDYRTITYCTPQNSVLTTKNRRYVMGCRRAASANFAERFPGETIHLRQRMKAHATEASLVIGAV